MALNFPYNPSVNDIYTDTTSGFKYQWTGELWKCYNLADAANIRILDDISSTFNGSNTDFNLTVDSDAITPVSSQQLDISLGGIVQEADVDYSVSASTITFTTPPEASTNFFGKILGTSLSLNTVADGSVTPASLTTTGTYKAAGWVADGSAGYGVTVNITGVNVTGVVTAISYEGDGSNLTGIAATDNISTSSLVVAGVATVNGSIDANSTSNLGGTVTVSTGNVDVQSGNVNVTTGNVVTGVGATIFNGGNAAFAGIVTSNGGFVGSLTGTATGLAGEPSITVTNLTVNGTETIINTNELNVRDKTVGIGSTTAPTSTTQDGAGIIIYGQTQVDFLYDKNKAAIGLNTSLNVAGFSTVGGGISVGGDVNVGSAATIFTTTGNAAFAGIVTATSFSGSGANLTGVIAGVDIQSSGSLTGTAITALNFSGATITADDSVGISTITIAAAGVSTAAQNPAASYATVYLDLANAQHHDIYLSAGITTFSCTGGNIGESHSVMVQQPSSGITTVGYSTAFLWAGGSQANFSYATASSEVELFTFVVKQAGAAGTVLLASASAGAYS